MRKSQVFIKKMALELNFFEGAKDGQVGTRQTKQRAVYVEGVLWVVTEKNGESWWTWDTLGIFKFVLGIVKLNNK